MRGLSLLIASCCFAGTQLSADPVYTYSATSVNMQATPGVLGTSIATSGPGFSLSGLVGFIDPPPFFHVGDAIPLGMSITLAFPDVGGTVDFGGIVQFTNNITGSAQELSSSSVFVIPPNPDASYTFSAQVTGEFTAFPSVCSPGPPSPGPPCGTSANLLINLPGELTVTLGQGPPYFVRESFVSTAVPEPSSIALLLLGAGMLAFGLFTQTRRARRGVLKISYGFVSVDNFEIHCARSPRTSSAGTPRPSSAS